jgi:hypothetical protein
MQAGRIVSALDKAEAAVLASIWEVNLRRLRSSASSVEKKLSAIALS